MIFGVLSVFGKSLSFCIFCLVIIVSDYLYVCLLLWLYVCLPYICLSLSLSKLPAFRKKMAHNCFLILCIQSGGHNSRKVTESLFIKMNEPKWIFFVCYVTALLPNLDHWWGDSLTNLMLINVFCYSIGDRKVKGSLVASSDPKARFDPPTRFQPATFQF